MPSTVASGCSRYDNPQLVMTYLSAFLLSGDPHALSGERLGLAGSVETPQQDAQFARSARDILDYMRRDMTHPDGGLFSAEVHDWVNEGSVWAILIVATRIAP